MLQNYKDVVDFAKRGFTEGKKQMANVPKLETILTRTIAGNAGALVQGVLRVKQALDKAYRDVDTHIQETIRESGSTYVKLAVEWGITTDDKTNVLLPLMNRAFGYNYQLKAFAERGSERLAAILEKLVESFDTPEAKVALRAFK